MDPFVKLIRQKGRFLLTTHANPDGDGLGSQMALHFYLRKMGKQSLVINSTPTPPKFALVDPHREIQVYRPGMRLPEVDAIFVLDTNDDRMLEPMTGPLRALKAPLIFVDHHVPEAENLDEHLIDEQYAATGELVFQLLRALRADIDEEIALALYVAIVTDTGGFRFKRTTSRSHLIAAELLQKGVLPEKVFSQIYARDSLGKTRLLGHVLESIQTSADGKVAWITIPRRIREKYGADLEDTESFVNHLGVIQGVQVGMMFREDDDGRVKVSLRGSGEVAVVGLAKSFGGGGHRHAAGMKISLPLETAVKSVVDAAVRLVEQRR